MTELVVRPLDTPEEMRAAVALYREVFELSPTDPVVSPRLLATLRMNGGSVIGAFADGDLAGFVYGFVGTQDGVVYHFSQMACVRSGMQGSGIGRALKLGQRDFVLSTGLTEMRWAFDPVRAHNAHFNLDVLGARARWYVRDLFGVEEMGRDTGQGSDRLVMSWDLTVEPGPLVDAGAPAAVPGWAERAGDGDDVLFGVPAKWAELPAERAPELREAVYAGLRELYAAGYEAVSCRPSGPGAATAYYRLRRLP
ncbi:MAG: hypothetical protein GEV11_09030 [Streptosporangiales bacterium]|nr:hypothetical protein [Streptosporangiales bacterium]